MNPANELLFKEENGLFISKSIVPLLTFALLSAALLNISLRSSNVLVLLVFMFSGSNTLTVFLEAFWTRASRFSGVLYSIINPVAPPIAAPAAIPITSLSVLNR